ncbi:MAG: hypothetical protein HZA58_04085, partial [Acidimicrobiia bacterium]|nr:hypothetical protein [Acidimicrobiia bacterium]
MSVAGHGIASRHRAPPGQIGEPAASLLDDDRQRRQIPHRGDGFDHEVDGAFGEEYGSSGIGAGRRWIIDPIDATVNYVRGVPVWATLIALEDDDGIAVGVVSAPALG